MQKHIELLKALTSIASLTLATKQLDYNFTGAKWLSSPHVCAHKKFNAYQDNAFFPKKLTIVLICFINSRRA